VRIYDRASLCAGCRRLASGYTSVFMGRPILYREVDCRALGQPQCRFVGKAGRGMG